MAHRTNHGAVRKLLGAQYDGESDLAGFISTANSIVDKIDTNDTGSLLSDADLELIERWLAAHFYGSMDQFVSSKNTGRASGAFQGQTAMIFQATFYGQNALALDVTGYLAKLQQQAQTGKQRVGMAWLGTRYRHDYSKRSTDQ